HAWDDSLPRLWEARDEMTRSVHTVDREIVSATLTVAVPAARVFAVLADPTTHSAIDGRGRVTDGTGRVQEAVDRAPLTEVGQIFRMDSITPTIQTETTRWPTRSLCSTRCAPSAGCRGTTPGATVSWSSAAGSGVTTLRRSVRPRLRSRSPTTGRRCRGPS